MFKTEIFTGPNIHDLTKQINRYFEANQGKMLYDIKLSYTENVGHIIMVITND